MTEFAALLAILVRNLPTLLAIIGHLERMRKAGATEAKVDESLKGIEKAFKERDAIALRAFLNSK